ncbi:MAG: hypothetical protein R3C19_24375 [Planctomycetaceae bacterium]
MQSASEFFSAEQRAQVAACVTSAESKTACEIVPVVASASGRYDRAEDIAGLWLAIVSAIAYWWMMPRTIDTGRWGGLSTTAQTAILIVVMVASFVAGVIAASHIGWLRRLFTPRRHIQEEVNLRARQLFFDRRVHHTAGATGILIYISLWEHRAAVLGDKNVVDTLGQPFLDDLCRQLTELLRREHPTDAICQVVSAAAVQLAEKIPRTDDDVNELADALVLID